MPEIQVPEIVQKLRERFQLKGHASISTLAPEIVPVVITEDLLREGASEWREAMWSMDIAAVAAEYSYALLLNPAGSGVYCMIDGIYARLSADGTVLLKKYVTNLANLSSGIWKDISKSDYPTCKPSWLNQVGLIGDQLNWNGLYSRATLQPNDWWQNPRVVLQPGNGLLVFPTSKNVGMGIGFSWRERASRVDD